LKPNLIFSTIIDIYYPATPNGEKYTKTEITIATTIRDRITSHLFQLARLAALSAATVVAKVNPCICASSGLGVSKLTITMSAIENKNNKMQK
jgi:hypothetical protein